MLRIGLTGGMGCGKSTVGQMMAKRGAHFIEADRVAHELMQHDLVDDYWLFVNPVVLAEGIPLFGGSKHQLKLVSAESLSSGVVALHYEKQ